MFSKWKLFSVEPLRSVSLSIICGGVMPIILFNLAAWIDRRYWIDNVYYSLTPLALPFYFAFSITFFPALIFLFITSELQKSFGNFYFFLAFSFFFNTCIYWIFWQFIWRDKTRPPTHDEIEPNHTSDLTWMDLLGGILIFFAIFEGLILNPSLLLSNLILLALGLFFLACGYKKRKVELKKEIVLKRQNNAGR